MMHNQHHIVFGVLFTISGVIVGWSSYKYWKSNKKIQPSLNKFVRKERSGPTNEVLFFPDDDFPCKNFFSSPLGCQLGKKCRYLHTETSLSKMCSYLEAAKTSIDVCLYILSNRDLSNSLIKAKKNGAAVRLLIDYTMAASEPIRLQELCDKGVVVQPAETRYMMHHKFAVIDQEILITGSFNWTAQATMGNWDNAIITSTPDLVAPFVIEFERMWHLFSNPQDPQDLEAAQKKLKKYPFLKNSAWDGIIIGHQTPQVCH